MFIDRKLELNFKTKKDFYPKTKLESFMSKLCLVPSSKEPALTV